MKKTINGRLAFYSGLNIRRSMLVAVLIAGSVAASFANEPGVKKANESVLSNANGPIEGRHKTDISQKALRHFKETFAGATGVEWSVVATGFVAKFTSDGVVTRDFYNGKGIWLYTIRYYDGKGLSAGLLSQVRSVYYDYAILSVQEIKTADKKVFLLEIEGQRKLMKIRVCDEVIEVLNEYDEL